MHRSRHVQNVDVMRVMQAEMKRTNNIIERVADRQDKLDDQKLFKQIVMPCIIFPFRPSEIGKTEILYIELKFVEKESCQHNESAN